MKLEECQYKGRDTFVAANQKWQLKEVSLVFCIDHAVISDPQPSSSGNLTALSALHAEPVILHPSTEHVSECPS